ncbi:MAG: hypothetical protein DRO99_04480 [Candidatus Aenigmatarchaeota archaeon]|nr:MAG: hypothetical protein DRO99_04480 [Candidatus Aenigmarchaeota archaeon]
MKGMYVAFAILLLATVSGCTQPESMPMPEKVDCNALQGKIESMIDQANTCTQDSDCVAELKEGMCPFGCYALMNKNANVNQIRSLMQEYNRECLSCAYGCAEPPSQGQIRCVDGRCEEHR